MDVNEMDYRELAINARNEVNESNADESIKKKMSMVIDTFVRIQEERLTYSNSWNGFALELNDIDSELYHKFQRVAQKLRKPLGYVVTKLMLHVLETGTLEINEEFFKQFEFMKGPVIQHYREIFVEADNLKEIDKISFQHIKSLKFANDITEELFKEKIGLIQHCKNIELPSTLSKLTVLAKTPHCKNYIFIN